jgi:tetratricopeptide (TPR) repeat protein
LILHAHQTLGRFLLLAVATIILVVGAASSAEAKPTKKEEASERFLKGVELYDSGDLRAALIEFRRAYELVPTYQVLYNMGQTASELKDYVEAYDYYKSYLRKGKDKIDTDRRKEVSGQIKMLEGYLASIKIRVSEDDAEVSVDGVVVGVSPLYQAIKVSAGRRKIVVNKEGFAPWERKLDLAGRDKEAVTVELISYSGGSDEENVGNPFLGDGAGSNNEGFSNSFWASATITGLFAIGTSVAAIQTYRASNNYDEALRKVPTNAQNLKIAGDNLRQLALITDVTLGLTAVGVITTLILAGRNDSGRSSTAGLQMQVGPTNVALLGEF